MPVSDALQRFNQLPGMKSVNTTPNFRLERRENLEDVSSAFYEAWKDAGLVKEAAPRSKGSRPSAPKRKVTP